MKESEPFFNFSEKTPLFLVGLFILIHFLTLFSSVPVDHGVLRPLHQSHIGVTSHTFRLFFHGFLTCQLGSFADKFCNDHGFWYSHFPGV